MKKTKKQWDKEHIILKYNDTVFLIVCIVYALVEAVAEHTLVHFAQSGNVSRTQNNYYARTYLQHNHY